MVAICHRCVFVSDVVVFFQASRARQLGATVYCVGVKDFNETQVNPSTHHLTTHHLTTHQRGTNHVQSVHVALQTFPSSFGR
jgi:hypothetical protein